MRIQDLLNPIEDEQAIKRPNTLRQPESVESSNYCLACRKSFGRYSEYSRHMKTIHPTSETQWHTCPNPGCKMRFTRPDALRDHLKTKKARLYNCQSPSSSKRKKLTQKAASMQEQNSNPSAEMLPIAGSESNTAA
jgi:hypothetical protein